MWTVCVSPLTRFFAIVMTIPLKTSGGKSSLPQYSFSPPGSTAPALCRGCVDNAKAAADTARRPM